MIGVAKQLVGKAPLTQVRTSGGRVALVHKGRPAPADISDDDRKRLLKEGYLEEIEVAEAPEEDTGPNPGTAEYILAEVGDDPAKAQTALDAEVEERGDKARKGLVKDLEAIIAKGGQGS